MELMLLHFFGCCLNCCSVAQSCPTLCDPMDCSTPGFPVLHYLLKFAQTHVHWLSDAIQPSHLLSPPSPPALNLSQRWVFPTSRLFASGGHSIGASASVLPMNIQGWFPLWLTGLIPFLSKGVSRVFQHHSSKVSIGKHYLLRKNKFSYKPMYRRAKRKTDFVPFEVQ